MASIAAATKRLPWWVGPITVTVVLTAFGIYSFYVAIFAQNPQYEDYLLSPFYSPQVGTPFAWLSPAVFVLWIPLGFRATCYYYRKAYYRAFFWDPPACQSQAQQREPRSPENYNGERALFVLNNIHRYFLYGSILVVAFLAYESVLGFFPGGGFGMTIGSLVLVANVVLLSLYTFSCHSFRHLVGGNKDCYSCMPGGNARRKTFNAVSVLNGRHSLWAWLSLFMVLFSDVYIRMLMAGWFTDPRI
ncbi:MAG: hypothetical protein WA982_10505, partial [Rubrobacteraceae bacterium]